MSSVNLTPLPFRTWGDSLRGLQGQLSRIWTLQAQSCSFGLIYQPNRSAAGASLQTPLGELTALPRPPNCVEPTFNGRKGGEEDREELRNGKGKGGERERGGEGRGWTGAYRDDAPKPKS